jgi:glycosyltransferase involved in cell wall biosynthesis
MRVLYLIAKDPKQVGYESYDDFIRFAESHQKYCDILRSVGHSAALGYFGDVSRQYEHDVYGHELLEFPVSVELPYGLVVSIPLLKYIVSERPDVVHIHSVVTHSVIPIVLLTWLLRIPIVLQHHGDSGFSARQRAQLRLLKPFLAALQSTVLAVNMDASDELRNYYPNTEFVPNGVDTDKYAPGDEETARKTVGFDDSGRNVLYLGRITDKKGVSYLIEAVAKLRQEYPGLQLHLVYGAYDEGTLDRLEGLVAERGLTDVVRFVGRVPDQQLPTYYKAADFGVYPSLSEGFPVVPLEAMSCGQPTVLTATHIEAGAAVTDGKNSMIARRASADSLAEKMRQLLDSPELRESMGEAARRTVVDRYSWTAVGDRVIEQYRQLGV